jgi:hypothetical protein
MSHSSSKVLLTQPRSCNYEPYFSNFVYADLGTQGDGFEAHLLDNLVVCQIIKRLVEEQPVPDGASETHEYRVHQLPGSEPADLTPRDPGGN